MPNELFSVQADSDEQIPFAEGGIHAGFPSPAQDYMTDTIDINKIIIQHKEATFYARVAGDSMSGAGIDDGDIVVIDKSIQAKNGDIVAAFIDGEFALKRFSFDAKKQCAVLLAENDKNAPIQVSKENTFLIWGVITFVIKKLH